MIGVSFGAPTEFRTQGKINEGVLPRWTPDRVSNAIEQDDLYVDMTFAKVLDDKGLDATTEDFGEMFKHAKYQLWHANLGKYDEPVVRRQLADAQIWVQRHIPDYKFRTLALPHGVYPREVGWALSGSAKGTTYRHEAILMVAGGAAHSPFSTRFDPVHLPRIQALGPELTYWLTHSSATATLRP